MTRNVSMLLIIASGVPNGNAADPADALWETLAVAATPFVESLETWKDEQSNDP